MSVFPSPTPAATTADLRAFFDRLATDNAERHGPAEALLSYRLRVLDRYAQFSPTDVVLDVGCGDGRHLRALTDRFAEGIGIDLSPQMVKAASRQAPATAPLSFRVDDAERLDTIPSASIDTVICVGVLEHVLHPRRVLRQVARVLRPTGRFVALTLNGTYWWYRLADRLGLPTRHLTTDRRFVPEQARQMLRNSGLRPDVGFWRFVPRGDLPPVLPGLCRVLDAVGRRANVPALRGGLRLCGRPHAESRKRERDRHQTYVS
jgi:2-polyprenyl-6-hydroxyphenyl methylase/3-demethylubiquinone-9 3-methyltransferase